MIDKWYFIMLFLYVKGFYFNMQKKIKYFKEKIIFTHFKYKIGNNAIE